MSEKTAKAARRERQVTIGVMCSNCALWQPSSGGPIVGAVKVGLCRRYPPHALLLGDGRVVSAWPTTQAVDGCAEFRPSQEATQAAARAQSVGGLERELSS